MSRHRRQVRVYRAGRPREMAAPPPGEPIGSSIEPSRRAVAGVAALVLLVVASYFPALSGGFVWDDVIFSEEPVIHRWSGLWNIWFSPADIRNEGHYWPIVYTTFWLEHKLWGLAPFGYHLVNVVLHLVNALLVWRVALCLAVPGTWALAAVLVGGVFDYCAGANSGKAACAQVPRIDSLYRFRMTGKASTIGKTIKFESGTLKSYQIDPYGASVIYDRRILRAVGAMPVGFQRGIGRPALIRYPSPIVNSRHSPGRVRILSDTVRQIRQTCMEQIALY